MVLVPLFEHSLLSVLPIPLKGAIAGTKDVIYWLADKGFNADFLGKEIRMKLDKIFAQLPGEAIKGGITLQLYSGSFDTTLEVLNEQNYPVKAIVALGGPSLIGNNWLRHITPGSITNPNVERLINIWGEKDFFTYIAGTGGYKEYLGADLINIEILGIGHTDYLNNSNNLDPSSLSYKAREFVNGIVERAYDRILLFDYLNKPAITYDTTRDLYTVDLNKLYLEDNI